MQKRQNKSVSMHLINAALRIVRNFAISGSLGILTGGLGTVAAGVVAYISIDEAEKDYNNCMKTAK